MSQGLRFVLPSEEVKLRTLPFLALNNFYNQLPPFRSFCLSVSISTKSGLLEPFLFWPDELDDPLLLLTPRYTIFYICSKKNHNTSKDLLEVLFLIHHIHDGSWMTQFSSGKAFLVVFSNTTQKLMKSILPVICVCVIFEVQCQIVSIFFKPFKWLLNIH